MVPRSAPGANKRRLSILSVLALLAACAEAPTELNAPADLAPAYDLIPQSFVSGSHVLTWDPIIPAAAYANWETTVCTNTPLVGRNANWQNQHTAYVLTGHPWAANYFSAPWINAWNSLTSQGPGGHNWTKYQTEVSGNGTFVIRLLADNCSWIYLDGTLVGVQGTNLSANSYGLTLNGSHTLEFIIFDGGGAAGGKFILETTTNPPPPLNPDLDGDSHPNTSDAFPLDPTEWADTDGDGVGDNGDAFPTNPIESKDSDGDGVGDNTDVEPTLNNNYYYVDWTAANPGAGTASGTITLPGGQTVGVQLKVLNPNGTSGSFMGAQTSGGTSFWLPNAPYVSAYVFNPPPATDIIQLTGGTTSSYVITFSAPVQDPVMDILSLGSGGDPSVYDFDRSFEIISQGQGYWGSGPFVSQPGEKLEGREGHGAIRFIGSFSTFSWSVPDGEVWHGFTLAIRGAGNANADYDGDGVPDATDNCPLVPNDQSDSDFDGVGNACDAVDDGASDSDGDGLTNSQEHGIGTNPTNPDTDGDGHNDGTDAFPLDPTKWVADADGDGVNDDVDNCPAVANGNQADQDGDNVDDDCDPDIDGDGAPNGADAFPTDPTETTDTDGDGVGDNGDAFPTDPTETTDSDGDGVGNNADAFDNDPTETVDSDGDGTGDNADAYDNSTVGGPIIIAGCNTGAANKNLGNGTWMSDLLAAAKASAANHGAYVSAVSALADGWKKAGLISGRDQGAIVSCAARSK